MNNLETYINQIYTYEDFYKINQFGCRNGGGGLTNTQTALQLYNQFSAEIWQTIQEAAKENGNTLADYLLENQNKNVVQDEESFKIAMVWTAVEKIAENELLAREAEEWNRWVEENEDYTTDEMWK